MGATAIVCEPMNAKKRFLKYRKRISPWTNQKALISSSVLQDLRQLCFVSCLLGAAEINIKDGLQLWRLLGRMYSLIALMVFLGTGGTGILTN